MTGTNIHDSGPGRFAGGETPTNDDHLATKKYVDDNGGTVDVTDGSTTVTGLTELDFTSGATVTDAGGGVAQVAVAGGGSQPDPLRTPVNVKDADDNFVAQIGDSGSFFQLTPGNEDSLTFDIAAITAQTGDLLEIDGADGETAVWDAHAKYHADAGITDLPTPAADSDAATKEYVDDNAGGIPQGGPLTADLDCDQHQIKEAQVVRVAEPDSSLAFEAVNNDLGSPGRLVFHYNTEPISGDLSAGDCALWFDKTDATAKLMIKGKTTDGTVVTGEVALA